MMRLFPEVISALAIGCDGWDWQDDAWRPHRLPAAMRPLYESAEGSRVRMLCTSSVRLRFVSQTRTLGIQLRFGVAARQIFKGALVVDGQKPIPFGPDQATPEWQGVIFEAKDVRLRTFDLWLPNMAQTDVVELQVDDGCEVTPAEPLPVRWLVYGDSITQGMTSSNGASHAVAIAALQCDAEALNLGIGGARLIAELATAVPAGEYDIISIAYGTNDFNGSVPVDQFQANAGALLDALAQAHPRTPVLLITPLTWASRTTPNANGVELEAYRVALRDIAAGRQGVTLLEGGQLIPDDESLFVDKVHPNDAGFAQYGDKLAAAIKGVLSQA